MNIKEKAAYIKGLFEGMDFDEDKKEAKILKSIIEWMQDVSVSISNIDEDVDDICKQLDVLDEDLSDVEEEVYDSCKCDCDDNCDCECGCDCDCDCDEELYEVKCPSCGEKICLTEDMLDEEEMDCPRCGELLEFDLSDCCDCEENCECDDDCDCDDDCECGCKDKD